MFANVSQKWNHAEIMALSLSKFDASARIWNVRAKQVEGKLSQA